MVGDAVPVLTVVALVLAAASTVVVGLLGVRLARTTSDFLVASRSVGPRLNAAAISGEYLSAASFLGVAGLIAKYGADALWYPLGFTAGYLALLLFVAAPLRRSGAYTVPDFAEFRLRSLRLRRLCTVVVALIATLYMVPQLQGAGLTLHTLLGAPLWVGAAVVGVVVIGNVVGGGMRSITFVQAFQYWLKLTAVAVPAVVLALHFASNPAEIGAPAPPTVSAQTTVTIATDVVVRIDAPLVLRIDGEVSGLSGEGVLPPGEHTLPSGTVLHLPAESSVPVVVGAPANNDDWLSPGNGFGGGHPTFEVYSLILATFLGTLGLPHVLVRFYTNPTGTAARRTSLVVIALLGAFYVFPVLLGVFARLYVPQLLITGTSDAAVLLLPSTVFSSWGGQLLAALVAAGAIAAFMSTSSGLLVCVAGVLSTDVLRGRVADFRVAAVVAGAVPLAIAVFAVAFDLSQAVGLVFAVAASTICPLLLLGTWWRRLTVAGAATGLIVGGTLSLVAVGLNVSGQLPADGWVASVVAFPAAVTVPLAFLAMIIVSLRTEPPAGVGRILARMHVPERLGLGKDRDRERWG